MIIFLGPNQTRTPVDLAKQMQELGQEAQYIRLQRSGKHALDFSLAFYLGELHHEEPQASFTVVSKDTGFDPLFEHLRERGMKISREGRADPAAPADGSREALAIKYLKRSGAPCARSSKAASATPNWSRWSPRLRVRRAADPRRAGGVRPGVLA